MPIFTHFSDFQLSNDQRKALEMIQNFLNSDESVFLLKGYAGSGKTTILKGVIEYLNSINKKPLVMAPTGRAARILRKKTETGFTIHKAIYNFEALETKHIENEETGEHTYKYFYPIRPLDANVQRIFIVDEASMVSNKESKHELFQFGTEILLQDLLTFSRVRETNNKIIFVGDPAQLPPINDNRSYALSEDFFKENNLKFSQVEMTQVMCQGDNTILKNATKLRDLIKNPIKSELSFDYNNEDFIKIQNIDIVRKYTDFFPVPELGQGVIIAYSNGQCLNYNQHIRSVIFPNTPQVCAGDILLISNNNYNLDLYNGDMVKVMEVSKDLIWKKNIPVFEKGVKKPQNLSFRKVKVRTENNDAEKDFYIIDSLLNSTSRDLTILEMKALFVDFVMRFREKYPYIKVGSKEFKDALKDDPFFNAMRVKYGYAITCHKSQGGEWDTTFVDYFGNTSLKEMPLRWSYTATTRASKRCFAVNAPYSTPLSKFSISEIGQISKLPDNAFYLENVPKSPFHLEEHHKCKSLKYWEIQEKLEGTPYKIENVQSLGDYQERYTISYQDENSIFDVLHNKAGIFNEFKALYPSQISWTNEVLEILEQPYIQDLYNIDYQPSLPILEQLYHIMQMACADCNIIITNVEEKTANFMVTYFLKTSSKGAYIQFYFNGKGQLTRALPKSFEINDEKLNQLII